MRPLCTVAVAGYKQHRLDSPSAPHSDKMQIRDYFVVLLRKLPANGAVGAAEAGVATSSGVGGATPHTRQAAHSYAIRFATIDPFHVARI
ncbi:hypothetical protein ACLKA7_003099 [Drosophila subpalustris]